MRILVACEFPEGALEALRGLGGEVLYRPTLTGEQLPGALAGIMALIIGRTNVTADAIAAGTTLQIIIRAGTDVSTIAIEEASAQAVFVANTPYRDAIAIAELMLALALALDRNLIEHAAGRGSVKKEELSEPRGMAGRTLGILGYAAAGRALAERARALGMEVVACSPTLTNEQARDDGVTLCSWPRDLGRRCDVICVDATGGHADDLLIDEEFLQSMRDGAHLVFVGSPAALSEAALSEAVRQRKIRVALDLSTPETGRPRTRLTELPGAIVTHRLARHTQQARDAIADEVVRILRGFVITGHVANCVNLLERSPAMWQLVLRLRDAVGVMAAIMDAVRADGVNAEEITSRVFRGARAAWCTIALDERPSTDALDTIRKIPGVLHLDLRAVV